MFLLVYLRYSFDPQLPRSLIPSFCGLFHQIAAKLLRCGIGSWNFRCLPLHVCIWAAFLGKIFSSSKKSIENLSRPWVFRYTNDGYALELYEATKGLSRQAGQAERVQGTQVSDVITSLHKLWSWFMYIHVAFHCAPFTVLQIHHPLWKRGM